MHWQRVEQRFFCPCHNGVFDPAGNAVSGPPADEGKDLPRYRLKVENGLLYIEAPVDTLADARGAAAPAQPTGPGHDPCLSRRLPREA